MPRPSIAGARTREVGVANHRAGVVMAGLATIKKIERTRVGEAVGFVG